MRFDQFLDVLRKSPRRWVLTSADDIEYIPQRKTRQRYCPLTYVYVKLKKHSVKMHQYWAAARALGLDEAITVNIMTASDRATNLSPSQAALRNLLLAATTPKKVK